MHSVRTPIAANIDFFQPASGQLLPIYGGETLQNAVFLEQKRQIFQFFFQFSIILHKL